VPQAKDLDLFAGAGLRRAKALAEPVLKYRPCGRDGVSSSMIHR
jgi:hypothetical protein